jgi:hypothetical protein
MKLVSDLNHARPNAASSPQTTLCKASISWLGVNGLCT